MGKRVMCFKDTFFGPMFVMLGCANFDFTILVTEEEKSAILDAFEGVKIIQKFIRSRKEEESSEKT